MSETLRGVRRMLLGYISLFVICLAERAGDAEG